VSRKSAQPNEQVLPREKWGAPPVNVSHSGGKWTIAGRKQSVSLNDNSFAIEIHAGPATWAMLSSTTNDMIVRATVTLDWDKKLCKSDRT
jgi:hypothetical protein